MKKLILVIALSVSSVANCAFAQNQKRPDSPPKAIQHYLANETSKLCSGKTTVGFESFNAATGAAPIPGILVTGTGTCLCGNANCSFWVFLKQKDGWRLVVESSAASVKVKTTGTHGIKDL